MIAERAVLPAAEDTARRELEPPRDEHRPEAREPRGHSAGRVRAGSSGVWGAIPMPPQQLPDADLDAITRWIAAGAGQ